MYTYYFSEKFCSTKKRTTLVILFWSGRRDSNSQQPAWKAGTLPLSYFRIPIIYYKAIYFSRVILKINQIIVIMRILLRVFILEPVSFQEVQGFQARNLDSR